MPKPLTPVTKKQLDDAVLSIRSDVKDLARHFTTALGKLGERTDNQFIEVNTKLFEVSTKLLEVNTKLDAIMSGEVLVTRKQIERLLSALEAQGIKLNVSEILAA